MLNTLYIWINIPIIVTPSWAFACGEGLKNMFKWVRTRFLSFTTFGETTEIIEHWEWDTFYTPSKLLGIGCLKFSEIVSKGFEQL